MARKTWARSIALLCAFALSAAACSSDSKSSSASQPPTASQAPTATVAPTATEAPTASVAPTATQAPTATDAPTTTKAGSSLTALGLWDDGPCDKAKEPLKIGLETVFASGVLTLGDQAQALTAAATAFNARGGALGRCVQVTTCDDQADPNKAVNCVRTLDEAGIAATVNDTTSFGPADVSAAFKGAGIPRFAISPGQDDFPDANSYPFDAGGTGTSIMMPKPLIDQGIKKIAIVRVDSPAATALKGIYGAIFGKSGAEFVADLPVPAGTTDYSQFILAAEAAGAGGIVIPLGGQEAIQVLRAGQQLGSKLVISGSLGTFPSSDIASLGDYAKNVILNAAIPPATADDPVVKVLTDDLAASGIKELQRENLKSSPMRSWVGLYALLYILRTAKAQDFSRANVKSLIEASGPIPMLGLTPDWTPKTDHAGVFLRTGNGYYAFWTFDQTSKVFKKASEANWDKTICGPPLGGPC